MRIKSYYSILLYDDYCELRDAIANNNNKCPKERRDLGVEGNFGTTIVRRDAHYELFDFEKLIGGTFLQLPNAQELALMAKKFRDYVNTCKSLLDKDDGFWSAQQRNNAISIAKGFAIIFVVMAHADMPGMLNRAIYLFHMPLFFITAGYFFKHETVENPWPFIVKRFKGLYVPFVKWSIFFLLIHNLLFKIGILNEVYGNWTGGTTHPYSIHQFWQRLTNIVFSMGGYDEFLAGAFWFFRGLLVASIAFVVLYYMLNNVKRLRGRTVAIPLVIFFIALGFALFKAGEGVKIVTLVQGGYRDTMGVLFFSIGVLYRKYEQRIGHSLWLAAAGAAVVLAGSWLECRGMSLSVRIRDVLSLPVTGVAGWLMTYNISYHLSHLKGRIIQFLEYCGEHTLYIFIWHVSAYKVVSLLKIWWYGLDPRQIGCHMVIHDYAQTDFFWILYTIAGVGIPLSGYWLYSRIRQQRRFF